MSSIRDKSARSCNSNYQQDIRYVFKLNNWIMGSLGIWPNAIRGIGRHMSKIAIAIFNFALSFAIVPCALHIIYDQKDLDVRLRLSGLLAFCLTVMTKYCIFVIHRPKIHRCIEYVKNDWWQVTFKSDRELMLKYATTGRNLTIIGVCFMYTAGIIYHLILPFCVEHKIDNQTIRPLVYPTYSKFTQSQISPIYEIVYVAHCMCGYTIYSLTAGACGLAALFVTHACGQIQVIMSRLENLLNDKNPNIHQQIAIIVKDHVRIVRFSAVIEEVLQEVCLVEFTSSVCIICLLEYYCIVDWKDDNKISLATYFLLFISFCFNVYILCYIGELLMEKSIEIGSKCYMINWYQLSPRSVRSLILIIAMSSHPIKLTAGRMANLSLMTFGNRKRTSRNLAINAARPFGLLFLQSLAESVTVNMSSIRDKSARSCNSNYQQDIRYVFKLNNWIMGSLGIWPIAIRGIGKHMSRISIAIFNFALSFAIVPCTLHIIYDQKNINVRLRLSGLVAFCLTAMTKYCIFVIHRSKIHRCIEYMKNDWWQVTFKSDRELMLKYATTGRNLTIIGMCFMYTAGIIYHLILPFCVEHKVDNQTIRPLVYPTYSKFTQSQISPIYEIVYVAHCMCGYTIYSVTVGACGLTALFVTHACGQIQILISRLEDLLVGERFKQSPNVHYQIAAIIDHVMHSILYYTLSYHAICQTVSTKWKDVCNRSASACPATLQSMPRVHLVQSSAEPVIANMESSQDEYVTSPNANYQRDVRYIFKPGNWILSSIGIWPVAIRGIGRYAPKIAIVVCNSALAFAIVPCILHMIYDQKDLNIRLKLFGLLGFCTTAMMKYCVLTIRRPKILRCIEHVKSDWWQAKFSSDRKLMLKYATTGRRLSMISATSMYVAGFIYHTILPFCTEHKVDNQTIRPLVYPTYSKFFKTQASPIYEMVYLAHCVCGYTMYSVTAGSCGLAAIFATHACGQIEVIISRLEDLSGGKNFEQLSDVNQRIAVIIKSHVRILRFSAAVEGILQEVCLLEFASSIFTMCLPEYYCIVSSQIGTRCFMIRWYQLPAKSVRSLVLVIAMSSHPIKISAGRMIDLSLATFGNVLKTSLAYLSFLRTLVV
ncbi:PREDICTED: uncharacterized protein LOC108749643 [Trachymyrmex septentrionalis]|uniref:uncharacterized protein LOC108749643 n=1 Tax=Trachymyrmex septentrionalis TaxID=34720 RepID=UPI00084ED1DD|nr:PREDICTED: uncharacterized protein LOC108749643 [Trachymyrmex septentrionalis]